MIWNKKGIIFQPDKGLWWQQYYGMLPTPIYFEESNSIRIYFSASCKDRFSRITFLDVSADNPSEIIYKHDGFILDVGNDGTFDDCGVIPSSIIKHNSNFYLYYSGFQRHQKTPHSIFSGLAISDDGVNFKRLKSTPILERIDCETSIRSVPSVMVEQGIFKMWYCADYGWKIMNSSIYDNKKMSLNNLKYGTSKDGISWQTSELPIFNPEIDEFGFGRPYIHKKDNEYKLFYPIKRESETYRIGYCTSNDGLNWIRKDDNIGIDVSSEGWDSQMICYPAVISVKDKTYMFYNGNNYGETGFGYAELINLQ